jgi:pimeloyl-ACP methyl ester carboxylesterase
MAAVPIHARDIYVTANGLRHHLIARGSPGSRVLMLIHGLTQQAHVFDAVATALAQHYHVYALDVRGRGETEWGPPDGYHFGNYVADLEAVREALGLERFSLIGTSMGGFISMYYAAMYPDRVQRVVFNDAGPDIDPRGLQRILAMSSSAPSAFNDLKAVAKYYVEENAPVLAGRTADEVMEYARWHVRHSDSGVYVWKMDPAVRQPPAAPVPPPMPLWDAFNAIKAPVLVVRGEVSDILSEETAAKMVAGAASGMSVVVKGVGHAPTLMEPEALAAIETFLGAMNAND